MKVYHDSLKKIMTHGKDRIGRNGKTRSIFGLQSRYKMSDGFPAITTKKLAFRSVTSELIWFLNGSTDNKELQKLGCEIWTDNANSDYWKPKAKFDGDLGRVYGAQWRNWQTSGNKKIDQITQAIEMIKKDPTSRRIIVSAWNPGEIEEMALPPCHSFFQFFVNENKLSVQMYQRSADMFLGVPFNIASYSLLLHLFARFTDTVADEFIHTIGDAHIYEDHFEAVNEQLKREPFKLPTLFIDEKIKNLSDLDLRLFPNKESVSEKFKLLNYEHHETIKAKMAV